MSCILPYARMNGPLKGGTYEKDRSVSVVRTGVVVSVYRSAGSLKTGSFALD